MFSHRNDEKILLNKAQHIKEIKVNGLENLHKVLNIKDIAEKSLDLYKQQDKNAFGIKINKLFSITPKPVVIAQPNKAAIFKSHSS